MINSTPRTKAYSTIHTKNILAVLSLATANDISDGLNWYYRARVLAYRLHKLYGFSVYQCAAVIAALSPNNKWERNCIDAETVCQAVVMGLGPEDVKVATFHSNKHKAFACLQTNDFDLISSILRGKAARKVWSFWQCILGDCGSSVVCIDGHAYAIWLGRRIATTRTPKISDKAYTLAEQSYVKAANEDGRFTPAELQAITWTTWRRLVGGKRK